MYMKCQILLYLQSISFEIRGLFVVIKCFISILEHFVLVFLCTSKIFESRNKKNKKTRTFTVFTYKCILYVSYIV